YTGGTEYSKAYSSEDLVGGSTTNLGSNTQTYFVPKAGATNLDDESQYDRYEIKYVDGSLRVVKSGPEIREAWDNRDISRRDWWYGSTEVPASALSLQVTARNGSRGDADLYVRRGDKPTTNSYASRCNGNNYNESVTV